MIRDRELCTRVFLELCASPAGFDLTDEVASRADIVSRETGAHVPDFFKRMSSVSAGRRTDEVPKQR